MTSRINERLLETLTFKITNNTGITLKSSNTNIHEYILPSSVGTDGQVLKIDSIDSNKATLTWTASGGLSGGNASTITLANETSDSDCFVIFSNNPTGKQPLKTNNDTNNAIKFNSTNGTLTTSTFNGNLTGNATTATNLSNTVPISLGGTNATSASAARSALGVDVAGTDNSTNVMLSSVAGNYLSLDEDNQILTAGVVPISLGGTNATSASAARTELGVDAAGTDNSTNVMLSSVAGNYLTLDEDNQILTVDVVPKTLGGTNATSASAARTQLGAQILLTDNEGEFTSDDKTKLNDSNMESNADTTSFTDVVNVGGLMTFNNTKPITGDIVIGEDDNDLMVVNSDMITNGYIRSSSRFSPVTNLNPTPCNFTIDSSSLDNIKHFDSDSSGNIDTSVYLNDIRDIDRVLVMGKIHISFSGPNIFASVLLIKRLYDSSGNLITSAGNSGNIEVGSGTDSQGNTRDAFLDGSNGLTMTRNEGWQPGILRNLGGHFLDTNPTEGVSGVSKISYHYAIIPLNDTPLDQSGDTVDGIRIASPVHIAESGVPDFNRSSAATILSLVPFSCNL